MWIENVSAKRIQTGRHRDPGANSMLISINDSESSRPEAGFSFQERYNFEFLDIGADEYVIDESMRCNEDQAVEMVQRLRQALEQSMNVIVHCRYGISRSGAVCEVGIKLGFEDPGKYRRPNRLVEQLMMDAIG